MPCVRFSTYYVGVFLKMGEFMHLIRSIAARPLRKASPTDTGDPSLPLRRSDGVGDLDPIRDVTFIRLIIDP